MLHKTFKSSVYLYLNRIYESLKPVLIKDHLLPSIRAHNQKNLQLKSSIIMMYSAVLYKCPSQLIAVPSDRIKLIVQNKQKEWELWIKSFQINILCVHALDFLLFAVEPDISMQLIMWRNHVCLHDIIIALDTPLTVHCTHRNPGSRHCMMYSYKSWNHSNPDNIWIILSIA